MTVLGYKVRALVTMLVMILLVLLLGGVAFIVGLIHPSRGLMAVLSRSWSRAILFCAGVRLAIEGGDNIDLDAPGFYMGNHQSALDIPIITLALRGDVRFMAKDSLFRIPLFGWVIRQYGFVPIERRSARRTLRFLDRMIERLRRNPISITVFPEGTRSRDGRLLPFRRGTMKIAQQAGLPVIPFSIDGSIRVHRPDRPFQVVPGSVTLRFGPPIAADEVVLMDQNQLLHRVESTVAELLRQPAPSRREENNNPVALGATA